MMMNGFCVSVRTQKKNPRRRAEDDTYGFNEGKEHFD